MRVTTLLTLRNTHLQKLVETYGSARAVAQLLGIHQAEFGRWLNLREYPKPAITRGNIERRAAVIKKLEQLCTATYDEIFPPEIRDNIELNNRPKYYARDADIAAEAILRYAARTTERLTYQGSLAEIESRDTHAARREVINQTLATLLNPRHRRFIELYYGLNGHPPHTLQALADKEGLSRERVRQILAKAERLLQQPSRADLLIQVLD